MSDTMESRLAKLERELVILKAQSTRDKPNTIADITGTFRDPTEFDEIVWLG